MNSPCERDCVLSVHACVYVCVYMQVCRLAAETPTEMITNLPCAHASMSVHVKSVHACACIHSVYMHMCIRACCMCMSIHACRCMQAASHLLCRSVCMLIAMLIECIALSVTSSQRQAMRRAKGWPEAPDTFGTARLLDAMAVQYDRFTGLHHVASHSKQACCCPCAASQRFIVIHWQN